jgi:hypothetical protein
MSDQIVSLLLALGLFLLMAAWIPFLDRLQRLLRQYRGARGARADTSSQLPANPDRGRV